MTVSPDDKDAVQLYRERYSKILGIEVDEPDTKKPKVVHLWLAGGLILIALVLLGLALTTKTKSDKILAPPAASMDKTPSFEKPPQESALLPLDTPEASQKKESELSFDTTDSTKPNPKADVLTNDSRALTQVTSESKTVKDTQAVNTQNATHYVVILSTASESEAIENAKIYSDNKVTYEVILSSSGAYGVVLPYRSFTDAQEAMKSLRVTNNPVITQPYIMSATRFKRHIYP